MKDTEFNGLFRQFEAHLQSSALAEATVVNYLADLRAFLRWSRLANGGDCSPLNLDASNIQAYRSYLQDTKGHVPATINRRLQALRKFYDLCVAQGWTSANPASRVALLEEVASERTRSLTADDISRLEEAVRRGHPNRAARDWAVLQVLLGAGLKLGELSQLRLADVHLEADPPYLMIRGTTDPLERNVPLEAQTTSALRTYLGSRRAKPGVDRFFVNRDGNTLSTRSVQRLIRRYAEAAGLSNLTTQSLRYVYAKRIYESEGDLKMVAYLLGHQHLSTTIRYLQPCLSEEDSAS
jgi:integrase/recombinase XerC